jgi:hypothetical protein
VPPQLQTIIFWLDKIILHAFAQYVVAMAPVRQ